MKTLAQRQKAYRKGVWLESLAAFYLMVKGYRILSVRYKAPGGEIDVVARKRNSVVFAEVKGRNTLASAIESVSFRNQNRVEHAARHFLSRHPELADCDLRFDIVAFAPPFHFRHLDNAWLARS